MVDNVSTAQALVAQLPDADEIPLPVVRAIVNGHLGPWDAQAQSYAVKSGVIDTAPYRHGQGHAYVVGRDEAILILVAAILAFAAGVAVVSMIRAIKTTGLSAQALASSMTR